MQNFRNYRPLTRAWGDATRNRCRFGAFRPPNHRFRQTFCTRPPQKHKPQEHRTTNGMKIDSRARANEKAPGRRSKEVEGSRGRSEPGRTKQPDRRIAAPQVEPKSASRPRKEDHGNRVAAASSTSQQEGAGVGKQRHHRSSPSQREGPWCRRSWGSRGRSVLRYASPRDRREIRCQGPSQRRPVPLAGRQAEQKKSPTPGQKDEPTSEGGCSQLASRLSHQRMRISVSLAILSSLSVIRRSIAKSMDPRAEPTYEYRPRVGK